MPDFVSWIHDVTNEKLYFGSTLDSHLLIYEEFGLKRAPELLEIEWPDSYTYPDIRTRNREYLEKTQTYIAKNFPTRKALLDFLANQAEARFAEINSEHLFSFLNSWPGVTSEMKVKGLSSITDAGKLLHVLLYWQDLPISERKKLVPKVKTQSDLLQLGKPGLIFTLDECREHVLPYLTNSYAYRAGIEYPKLNVNDRRALLLQMNEEYLFKALNKFRGLTEQDKKIAANRITDPDLQSVVKAWKENTALPVYAP